MEEIHAYQTSDGMVFTDKEKAIRREVDIDFEKWYDDNKLYGNTDGSYADSSDVIDWIRINKKMVLRIIGFNLNVLHKPMIDSEVPRFFLRASGRIYTSSKETCVNDIKRICATFWNEEFQRIVAGEKE